MPSANLYFKFVDATSLAGKTGLTVTANVRKVTKSGTVSTVASAAACTEVGDGVYLYTLSSPDFATYDYLATASPSSATGLANADADALQADFSPDVQSRIPAALTGDGNLKADALKFAGNDPVQTAGKLWVLDGSGNALAPAATALSTATWTGTIAGRIDAAVSSRMATYTQPTGFLTADFTRLDAAISTRSTYAGADTSGTTTLLGRLTSTRAGLLDNLDAAISTRSTYAGADTSGTTTLLARITGAVPLASDYTQARAAKLDYLDAAISSVSTGGVSADDIAGAVWAAATRTLTTLDAVTLAASQPNYAPAKAGDAMTLTSAYDAAKAAASAADVAAVITHGDGAWLTATGFSTLTAAQVWSYGSGRTVTGLPSPAPEGYGGTFSGDISGLTDEQAAQLAFIAAHASLITAGALHLASPLTANGANLTLIQGADYTVADGTAIAFDLAAGPDLTGATVTLLIGSANLPGSVTGARSLTVEITHTQSAALALGSAPYELHATLASGHVLPTLVRGIAHTTAPL